MRSGLCLIIAATFVPALAACRSPGAKTDSATLDDQGSLAAAGTTACDSVAAADTAELNGSETFDLTARCVFNRDVHEVRVRILSETFAKVLDDGCSDRDSGYGHVEELILDGHRIANVGIKVRGNTSRCNPKRQFKFKFDAKKLFSVWQGRVEEKQFPENKGRRFFGLEGLSVRTSVNDPTMIRERVSSRVFTHAENLAPSTRRGGLVYRVAFTKLFVSFNRQEHEGPEGTATRLFEGRFYDYKGLYSLAENIDETFLQTRYQDGDTKLKNFYLYQADLAKAKFDRESYTRKGWSQEFVNGKEPESEEDQAKGDAKLFELFDLLKPTTPDATLAQAVDVESVASYVAAAQLSGHWDSLLANRNNDFLFFDGQAKRWKVITWDLDNSQGALKPQYDALMANDIYNPATANRSKLFEELFTAERPAFRTILRNRLKGYLTTLHREGDFNAMIDEFRGVVQANAESWEGFNWQSYEDLKSFVKARRSKISPQVGL